MRRAKVKISTELLADALHFPHGTNFIAAMVEDDCIMLVVEHHAIRDIPDGSDAPFCLPSFTRQEPVIFNGWGQGVPFSPSIPNGPLGQIFHKSSNVDWTQYDAEEKVLQVAFKGGGTYRFLDVPAGANDRLLSVSSGGGSVGTFIGKFIKSTYRSEKVLAAAKTGG